MRSIPLITALALFSGVSAQGTLVNPSNFRNAEGNLFIGQAIGSTSSQARLQQIIQMPSGARMINGFALRRDNSFNETYPTSAMICDIYMSQTRAGVTSQKISFDENHDPTNKLLVAQAQTFVFPESPPSSIPRPFDYRFPFDTPFPFTGLNPKRLCLDVIVYFRTNRNPMYFDAAGNWDNNPFPVIYEAGVGCTGTGLSDPLELHGQATPVWGMKKLDMQMYGANAPADGTVLLTIGKSDSVYGGLPLPFTLPGTATAPSGPCTLHNDILATIPLTADGAGLFSTMINTRINTGMNGLNLFSQAIASDATANPYGLLLSNMLQFHIVAPFPTTLSISYSYSEGTIGPSGQVTAFQGLVVELN